MAAPTAGAALRDADAPLHRAHDLVMLDLDGVVYRGADAVPGAASALGAIADAGGRLAYLTNNASRTAREVADHLRELAMPVRRDDDVVTAAQAVARLMAEHLPDGAAVLVIGGEGLRAPLVSHGLRPVSSLEDEPAAVVQGFHPELGWAHLAEAAYAVASGLPWFASNTDSTIPTARGVAPGNGALVQAVATATGRTPVVAGKPERPLFDEALGRTGARTPLMVGDRVDTDLDGARAAGVPSLAVLTGISDLDELAALPAGRRPEYVAPDVGGLLVEHAPVVVDGDRARCGGAQAELRDAVVHTGVAQWSVEALRAALGLVWATRDAGVDARIEPAARAGWRAVP